MNYKIENINNITVGVFKDDRFKINELRVTIRSKYDNKDKYLFDLLTSVISSQSKKYDSIIKMKKKSLELYDLNLRMDNIRSSNETLTIMIARLLNNKYTHDTYEDEVLEYINEVLFNPNFDGEYVEDLFKSAKNKLIKALEGAKENTMRHIKNELIKEVAVSSNLYLDVKRDLKIVKDIELSDIKEFYEKILKENQLAITLVGDYEFDDIVGKIKRNFTTTKFNPISNIEESFLIPDAKEFVNIEEYKNQDITDIVMLFQTNKKLDDKEKMIFSMVRDIVGHTGRLFSIVREKHSLCYSIGVELFAPSNAFFIRTGVSNENAEKAITIIRSVLNEVIVNGVTEKEFELAKSKLISQYEVLLTGSISEVSAYFRSLVLKDKLTIEDRIKLLKEITIEDVNEFVTIFNYVGIIKIGSLYEKN